MSHSTFVLRSQPGELTFFDQFQDALDLIKEQNGMEFEYMLFEEGASDLARHIYLETQERAILNLCEDFSVPARYITVEAGTKEEVEQLSERLKNLLPYIPLEELQNHARENMNHDPQLLFKMALGTNEEADDISLEILRQGLNSENELVRFHSVMAIGLTHSTEFLEDLTPMSENDPSPDVRRMVVKVLQAWSQRF